MPWKMNIFNVLEKGGLLQRLVGNLAKESTGSLSGKFTYGKKIDTKFTMIFV
jgi:hypothetical protein